MPGSDWDVHYRSGELPWETGRPSSELQRVVADDRIVPCRAIELGCGTGINAIWLAQRGFDVTAVDFSGLAIAKARERAAAAGATVRFVEADVLDLPSALGTFSFFFDRGCYHVVRMGDAPGYVRTLQRVTSPGALGLILAGNAREPKQPGKGPPVVAEADFHAELEPAFAIVRLREFRFDEADADAPHHLAWSCLVRRP